jgi:2-keto-4-pentenoate hydratase/2-oxohepta-3-ene-1,7-dioic acid hydratase in catechol pathway
MKIIRFRTPQQTVVHFGCVVDDHAVAFTTLASLSGQSCDGLGSSRDYLAALPGSEARGRSLCEWASDHLDRLHGGALQPLDSVRLETPVEVASLFDFGLTPRHLESSCRTWRRFERDDPATAPLIALFEERVRKPRTPPGGQLELLSHYKCNMNAIVGDDVDVPWPWYTEYLDVEPELAVVYGNSAQPIAGYTIFNDVSARDVQPPELGRSFFLAKDMARGNQLGPCLVTADEVGNPFDLAVRVDVNGAERFRGSTAEIIRDANAVIATLEAVAPLLPGSVMGFGTIPDCTGLDNGDFLSPGDKVVIAIERLGSLRCRLLEPTVPVQPSRWPHRPELDRFRRKSA